MVVAAGDTIGLGRRIMGESQVHGAHPSAPHAARQRAICIKMYERMDTKMIPFLIRYLSR